MKFRNRFLPVLAVSLLLIAPAFVFAQTRCLLRPETRFARGFEGRRGVAQPMVGFGARSCAARSVSREFSWSSFGFVKRH